ncbi:MAG: hypothetical protein HY266_00905 [Deltaproteobacteria bacterium]|nr:hypothetical protein [Deltaproteobacteria bacterium]
MMKEMEAYMWFERRKEVKAMVYKRGIKFIAVLTGLFFMGMLQTYSLAGEISQEASKKEIKPVNPPERSFRAGCKRPCNRA